MKMIPPHFRVLSTGAAAMVAALIVGTAPAWAGTFDYISGTYTETFDALGPDGFSTATLTDLANADGSPWTIGIPTGHNNAAPALQTGQSLQGINDGNIAVVGNTAQMFNVGFTGDPDRALGTGNTVNDPMIDLAIRNASGHALLGFNLSYDTEFWRGGTSAGTADFGFSLFYSTTGVAGSWQALGATVPQFFTPGAIALNGNDSANRQNVSTTLLFPTPLAIGSTIYVRWLDTNDVTDSPDAITALDNVQITELGSLVYNRNHTVPGPPNAPDGQLVVGGGNYFLVGGTPTAFTDGSIVKFTQNGNTNIDVPNNVSATILAEHASGTYTLGGAGQISGAFSSTGAGQVVLTNTNLFTSRTLGGGGIVSVQAFNALGSTGNLTVDVGGTTLELAADNSFTGTLNGAGNLRLTGEGTLSFNSAVTGTGTGGIKLEAGKIFASVPATLGTAQTIDVSNNAVLEFAQTVDAGFSPFILRIGTGGVTLSSTSPTAAAAITVTTADSVRGSATITKSGIGTYRFSAAQPNLTSPWVINEGAVEVATAANALGTGPITVNPGGILVVSGTAALTLLNDINLNGGALGGRTGNFAVYGTTANTLAVQTDSLVNLRSNTTPASVVNLTVASKLTGNGVLTLTGPMPSLATLNGALILTNPANNYSGQINVNSMQNLTAAPASGSGNPLGTSTIVLRGGILNINDNGTTNNGTLAYGNNVIVDNPTDGLIPGVATINVARQATGTFTGNTVQLGTLSFGSQQLTVTGANGYGVSFGATTLTGAAVLNTTTVNVTMGPVTGDGLSLTKNGTGNLNLIGANTYSGVTVSSGGALTVSGSLAGGISVGNGTVNVNGPVAGSVTATASVVNVANAIAGGLSLSGVSSLAGVGTAGTLTVGGGPTTITPGDAAHHGALHFGDTTLGQTAVDTVAINFNVDTVAANRGYLDVGNLSVFSGTIVTLNLVNTLPAPGIYPIIDYSGATIDDTTFNAFKLAPITNPRIVAVLNHNTNSNIIELNVQTADAPRWTGGGDGVWTTATQTPKNWQLIVNGGTTDYLAGEDVLFDNNATNKTVRLTAEDVSPSRLTFNNSGAANTYTVTGNFAISGTVTLTKMGTGAVTIENTNTFTGPVSLQAGTINVATVSDAGLAGPLGSGTTINFNGGTLNYTGATAATNRTLNFDAGGGTVSQNGTGDLTLGGALTGAGVMTKTGPGKLVLTGPASSVAGVTIAQGVLALGENSGSPGSGPLINNAALTFEHTNAVTVLNTISGPGTIDKLGFGTTTLGGTSANTNTGLTTVTSGTLVAGKPAGVNAIGGDLRILAGATFMYQGHNVSNQIADTATVTVEGTFGEPGNANPTNPGASDAITTLQINAGGIFGSGRNTVALPRTPFVVLGTATVAAGGIALAQRGGGFSANTLVVEGTVNLDGGSTTASDESYVMVGAGGLKLNGGTFQFNAGPSALTATSKGSILFLNGDVTSTGSSSLQRLNTITGPIASVDLGGAQRTFNVTDALTIGSPFATVNLTNGGVIKDGPGTLNLGGLNDYAGATVIRAGIVSLSGSLSGATAIEVQAAGTLDVSALGNFFLGATQTLAGSGLVTGTLQIDGKLAPGTPGGVPSRATLTFNSPVILGANAVSDFELAKIGGVRSSDRMVLLNDNPLTYGGVLHVSLSGEALVANDTFDLFDSTLIVGQFASLDLPALPNGLIWNTDNLNVNGTLSVIVPEPTGCALMLGGMGLLALRRRRRGA